MKVLVLNCGSSSLKYQLIDMSNEEVLCIGLVERIGIEGSILKQEKDGVEGKLVVEQPMKNHQDAIKLVLEGVVDPKFGGVKDISEVEAVGHRVVHGGEKFASSVKINDEVMKALEECVELAPLHNPANIMGIEACEAILPGVPMVGVFDTAFHQTMPKKSYLYGLPHELYTKYGVRRYGFHGTSHKYVSQRAAEMLGKNVEDLKIITCHLGNGASVAAVDGGKCVDTSMGFTPLEGLIMGTRCGDIDAAILPFLMEKEGLDAKGLSDLMNKQSGVYGMTGISSDFRDIEGAAAKGDEKAQVALDAYVQRVQKYIGAYVAEMNGVDAVVFTAGVGENGIEIRESIASNMEFLGMNLDKEANKVRGKETVISTADSKVKILLVPTNEELMIARDTVALVK
ncbi:MULTISPECIES: acetate/propionate family kinase [Paraclostridium]|jgi:acetate kinase|uniref:Acetate kinase n=3 Tax=Clostridia TaxID=186801 RepID=A0A1X2JIX2_PARBF|nr:MULTISPECIES: acetate kinase [Paraclostridium]KGJ50313.1 acetate kinase [Clostridium sp. NCR]MCU9806961.1 acetate kinase [Paraclostridium sp. AKS46]MDV8108626.1 acetate kinase [Bacillus sp. BAU-SS-2023]RDC50944.1 acetate kinase [Acinetobacter sp. RIT592]EQK43814.1 acetate kinase [[Clostridium] bifermentans ATCC 638] [Paraclostridium bifermentans ATCC 638 = DSM 14991]